MICSNCKSEFKEGEIYCPHCGKANQIVPDYNPMDEDMLTSILEKKEGKGKERSQEAPRTKPPVYKRGVVTVALIVVLIGLLSGIQIAKNTALFNLHMADLNYADGDFDTALSYYREALSKEEKKVQALTGIGNCLAKLGNVEGARSSFREALKSVPEDLRAFKALVVTYDEAGDYDELAKLASLAISDEEKEIFKSFYISSPEFSVKGGTFDDDLKVAISSEEGFDIFYTTDGSDPKGNTAQKYKSKLAIKDGTTTLKAVCRNPEGKFGQIKQEVYRVAYVVPDRPKVSPMTGVFHNPVSIIITTNSEGAKIYYTWNGTDPTELSEEYTGPIYVPKGESILSVIVVDKHGLSSDVLRCSYSYLPNS